MTTIRSRIFRCRGFTLVELAIVLIIVALIFGSGLTLFSAQQDQRRIEDTNALLSDAREALIGFALSHTAADLRPYLPCPDVMNVSGMTVSGSNVKNDGVEDRIASGANAGACDNQEGNLPWVTLGLTPQIDAWSNRLRYRVTDHFSNSASGMQLTFTPPSSSAGDINVLDAVAGNTVATAIPAVILSHGKNGFAAINAAGKANPAATSPDELANAPASIVGHTTFVSHSPAPAEATGGEFDDQVIWLSPNILFNRMVQAGKLP